LKVLVFPELCHGCGSCTLNCPTGAIREVLDVIGTIERGWAGPVEFAQGTMNVGEPMAVPIIRQLKQWAIPILMRIPLDRRIAESYSDEGTLVEALPEYREQREDVQMKNQTTGVPVR
jgi:MinD superfamily P-loop ATPase